MHFGRRGEQESKQQGPVRVRVAQPQAMGPEVEELGTVDPRVYGTPEQQGLDPLPVPEEEPDPEFDAFWENYLEAHENNDPQMIRENEEWWHRMRWERHGIPG